MTNQDTVLAFIEAWNIMDWDAACDLLSDNVIWHNIPMESIQGREAVEGTGAMFQLLPEGVADEISDVYNENIWRDGKIIDEDQEFTHMLISRRLKHVFNSSGQPRMSAIPVNVRHVPEAAA